jgi:hypothetical protein
MILSLLTTIVLSEFASFVEADFTLKESLDVSQTITLADAGRHVVIHDACEVDGMLYLAGGATSTSSYGGMDAIIYMYNEGNYIKSIRLGGYQEDIFYSIHCGTTLWVSGYSTSPDFLNDPTVRNFGKAFLLELDKDGNERQRFVSTYGFDSHLYSLDVKDDYVVAVGHVQRVTESDVYVVQYQNGLFRELMEELPGYDRLNDVEISDRVIAVGISNSPKLGANGMRGILVDINEYSLDIEVYKSSSDSRFHTIDEGIVLGSLNGQGLVYDSRTNQTQIHPQFEDITTLSPIVGTLKSQTILGDKKLPGRLVAKVDNTYIFQEEGMLYKAYLYIPVVLERSVEGLFLNGERMPEAELEVIETSVSIDLVWQIKTESLTLITRVVRHPKLGFCNVKNDVYYHSITLLCNQTVYLNNERVDASLLLTQPGEYELYMNETRILFSLREANTPVIDILPQTPRLAVRTTSNNWWMIPASWVGLFWLKKLQE